MIEEIITALSRIRWLKVIARNSTFTYKAQAVDVKQLGASWSPLCTRRLDPAGAHLWADPALMAPQKRCSRCRIR
jgi:hypothetical protein